jgi:hypothetical protein
VNEVVSDVKRASDLAWFFGDALTVEIVDKAQLVGEERVMDALWAAVGESGNEGVLG